MAARDWVGEKGSQEAPLVGASVVLMSRREFATGGIRSVLSCVGTAR